MISGASRSPSRNERAFDAVAAANAGTRTAPGVLVVDDDPDVLELMAEALASAGYRVLSARDGIDAMDDLTRRVPGFGSLATIEVVVTDLIMPHASGLDLLRHMRSHRWLASVVVVSAYPDHDLWSQALELGATAVLHKPFFVNDLVALVDRLAPLDLQ